MTDRTPFDLATARYRRAYKTADRQLAMRLVSVFETVIADLEAEAARIVASLDGELSVSQAMRLQRTAALIRQAETEIGRLIPVTRRLIEAGEIQGAKLGTTAAEGLTAAASGASVDIIPGFARLPTQALVDLAASLDSNTPLGASLNQLGESAAEAVRKGLERGLGAGRNPNAVASRIRRNLVTLLGGIDGAGVPTPSWLYSVSRTSLLSAYRSSTLETFRQNRRLLAGWVWHAALDERCCIQCVVNHGSIHKLEESFSSHRNCRCAMLPLLQGVKEIPFESGEAWFARQPLEVQSRVNLLGGEGARRWNAGDFDLQNMLEPKLDTTFGPYVGHGSIERAVQRAQGRRAA